MSCLPCPLPPTLPTQYHPTSTPQPSTPQPHLLKPPPSSPPATQTDSMSAQLLPPLNTVNSPSCSLPTCIRVQCTCTLHPLLVLERPRQRVPAIELTFEYFEYCQQLFLFTSNMHTYVHGQCTLRPLLVLKRSKLRVPAIELTQYFEYCQQPLLFKLNLQQYFTSVWHRLAWCEKGIPLARSYVAVSNILYFFMEGLNMDNQEEQGWVLTISNQDPQPLPSASYYVTAYMQRICGHLFGIDFAIREWSSHFLLFIAT